MLDSATGGITVYSPGRICYLPPVSPSSNPNSYHVFGIYPPRYFITTHKQHGDKPITLGAITVRLQRQAWKTAMLSLIRKVENGAAFERDGEYLTPGVLNPRIAGWRRPV